MAPPHGDRFETAAIGAYYYVHAQVGHEIPMGFGSRMRYGVGKGNGDKLAAPISPMKNFNGILVIQSNPTRRFQFLVDNRQVMKGIVPER